MRAGIETVHLSGTWQWHSLLMPSLPSWPWGLRLLPLLPSSSYWGTGERSQGMRLSLKTSFLEPDQASCAVLSAQNVKDTVGWIQWQPECMFIAHPVSPVFYKSLTLYRTISDYISQTHH